VLLVMINVPLVLVPLLMVKPLLLDLVVLVVSTDTTLQLVNVLTVTSKMLTVFVSNVVSHVKLVLLLIPVLNHVPEKTDVLNPTVTVVMVIMNYPNNVMLVTSNVLLVLPHLLIPPVNVLLVPPTPKELVNHVVLLAQMDTMMMDYTSTVNHVLTLIVLNV
jgi:hypothetical protein